MFPPSSLPIRPKVSKTPPTSPPSISKKRLREELIQPGVQSETETEVNQGVHQDAALQQGKPGDSQQDITASLTNPSLPLSRKERRRQLRSVSKQSTATQPAYSQQDLQSRCATRTPRRVVSMIEAEADRLERSTVSAAVSSQADVLLQLFTRDAKPKAGNPARPESLPVTPTRPVLTTGYSHISRLPQGISYADALAGITAKGRSGDDFVVVARSKGRERALTHTEQCVQFECDKQEKRDTPTAAQDVKRKKRGRGGRKRKTRHNTSESTAVSTQDSEETVATGTTFATSVNNSPQKRARTQQHSIAISDVDTLVEEEDENQDEDDTAEGIRRVKRARRQDETNKDVVSVAPDSFMREKNDGTRPVEIAAKGQCFMETIRQMLTNNVQRDSSPPPPSPHKPSPIPQKYLSVSSGKPILGSRARNASFTQRLLEVGPEYGPQNSPLMPPSWVEARTWDMSPPPDGKNKIFLDSTQRQAESDRRSNPASALALQTYAPLTPPFGTAFQSSWEVSRYLEQKQVFIGEHRKREGLRWAVMKAVERNLDVQKRREEASWPKNWNGRVEKDAVYMKKMVDRVGFLMSRRE